MALQVFAIPNFRGTAIDHVLCNTSDPNANGVVHYAYTVGAEEDAVSKRMFPWIKTQEFAGDYGRQFPEIITRLSNGDSYRPGEGALECDGGPTFASDQDTVMRLGALELLANLSSGRLSTTDKDPFPHQLALQQYIRKPPRREGLRRILIADEVGLGKTIEVGLVLRDILLSRGQLDGFRCLYLTSGGLIEDAAEKLRDVLAGIIDGDHIVATVPSFREYGKGNTLGVHVASMHAARLYVTESQKFNLPPRIRPEIIIIDECHHAASEGELAGTELRRSIATQTYIAAKQLLDGQFWIDSAPPQFAVLMSATPFRSDAQFVNLLRLLTNGVRRPEGSDFRAFDANVRGIDLRSFLQDERAAASVVWRRQSDESVRSWSGSRIFPNLTVKRPHKVAEHDLDTPRLPPPSAQFLELLGIIKGIVSGIAFVHGQTFGGFATAQLEKKLTSSSIAGACWIFSWAVRHCQWDTQDDYKNDKGAGTEGLRRLIRSISQKIATYNQQSTTGHATVRFPSESFEFDAKSLAQAGILVDIQKYSKTMREDAPDVSLWVADQAEISLLVATAERLLELAESKGEKGAAEDAKLAWLNAMLERYPDDRFLLFTESLQTCEALQSALGSTCRMLVGSMSRAARNQAVADLRNPRMNARVLVATSAADEGFDLQIASKVIHWDLSSSPATLMQRNGRVARLGQVTDVIAYYLILTGTHEERRDNALQQKFADLGIDDEALKSRILGSLSEEEETRLEQAIDDNEVRVVGDILKKAANDNERMDRELADIRTTLQHSQVLSRTDLANRLEVWKKLGLPDGAIEDIALEFDSITWHRPVFEAVSRLEPTNSKKARMTGGGSVQEFVFDPDFLVFGPKDEGHQLKLAGIPPWIKKADRRGKYRIIPYTKDDLIGRLLEGMARLPRSDFLAAKRDMLDAGIDPSARWLLFCTHPLREVENALPPKLRSYLTYYAFPALQVDIAPTPLKIEGADATDVHRLIHNLEQLACNEALSTVEDLGQIAEARQAGSILRQWVQAVTRFGAATFLEEPKYFVPIPVALVSVIH